MQGIEWVWKKLILKSVTRDVKGEVKPVKVTWSSYSAPVSLLEGGMHQAACTVNVWTNIHNKKSGRWYSNFCPLLDHGCKHPAAEMDFTDKQFPILSAFITGMDVFILFYCATPL